MSSFPIHVLSQNQFNEVNHLITEAFQYPPEQNYFDDFPIWNTSLATHLGIYDSGKLVSHVGYRLTEMKTKNGNKKIALIGAVATKFTHRGRGLSRTLLQRALQDIDAANSEWALLWGSEHDFYAKLGFSLQGTQARAPLSALNQGHHAALTSEVVQGMNPRILSNLRKSETGISLTPMDEAWIKEQKTVKWLSMGLSNEDFAFIGFERGLDLKGMVHEMGGNKSTLKKLLLFLYHQHPEAELLGRKETLIQLGFPEHDLIEEFLCLARPKTADQIWDPEFWVSGIAAC